MSQCNGKFVISIDFEKYWGMRDFKSIESLENRLLNVDDFILKLLKLFEKYEIHATWATVGFLFHRNKDELLKFIPSNKPNYKDFSLSPYPYIEQNSLEPTNYHFADKIIKSIIKTDNQEIASHTYSHYYCLAEGQSLDEFKSDLEMFNEVHNPTTIIFPRNLVNETYLQVLPDYGINIYRGNEEHFIYQPIKSKVLVPVVRAIRLIDRYINLTGHNTYKLGKISNNLLNIPSSRLLALYLPKLKLLEPLRLKRIKKGMNHAAKKGEVFHLWFHPHEMANDKVINLKLLESIFKHYKMLKEEYDFESINLKGIYETCQSK